MKTTTLFRTLALAVLMMGCAVSNSLKAEEPQYITNQEVEGDRVVAETVYVKEGNYLHNHLHYDFTYDGQNRLIAKTATKWDGSIDEWKPYFQLSYRYDAAGTVTMRYARWDESRQAYDKDVEEKTVVSD